MGRKHGRGGGSRSGRAFGGCGRPRGQAGIALRGEQACRGSKRPAVRGPATFADPTSTSASARHPSRQLTGRAEAAAIARRDRPPPLGARPQSLTARNVNAPRGGLGVAGRRRHRLAAHRAPRPPQRPACAASRPSPQPTGRSAPAVVAAHGPPRSRRGTRRRRIDDAPEAASSRLLLGGELIHDG
jgi:hypothetical protein